MLTLRISVDLRQEVRLLAMIFGGSRNFDVFERLRHCFREIVVDQVHSLNGGLLYLRLEAFRQFELRCTDDVLLLDLGH